LENAEEVMQLNEDRGQSLQTAKGVLSLQNPTMTEILLAKKERLESELSEVNEALTALRANPEIERVINLVTKIRH
jgi:hypothetical protein